MASGFRASVVMTCYNRADLLKLTLRRYGLWESSKSAELILVDDCSTDNVGEVLKYGAKIFGRVRHVRMDKKLSLIPVLANNPALGINLAVSRAEGEVIVKTDPECYPLTDVIKLAIERFRADRLVFCRCIRGAQALNDRLVKTPDPLPTERDIDRWGPGYWETKQFVCKATRWAYWFTSVFSRSLFVKIGGVDERFLSGFAGEDDEWAERMRRNGAEYHHDDDLSVVHLWHPAPNTGGKPFHGTELHERNKNLLWEARQKNTMTANAGHEWASPKAVVSEEIVTA